MINADEKLLSINQIVAIMRPRFHRETVRQWILFGRKSKVTDALVYLEHKQLGGRLFTSVEAVERFYQRLGGEQVEWLARPRATTK